MNNSVVKPAAAALILAFSFGAGANASTTSYQYDALARVSVVAEAPRSSATTTTPQETGRRSNSRWNRNHCLAVRATYAFFTNCDFNCIAPIPSILQSMS